MKATVQLNLAAFVNVVTEQVARPIKDAVFLLKRRITEKLSEPKSGPPGKYRQASAIGEAPAIQSGNLLRNLKESFPNALTGQLLIDTEYAEPLETVLQRPYYTPAIESLAGEFENLSGRF